MKAAHIISFILLIVGGLNWGLVGVGTGDIVSSVLGDSIAKIIFILVGLAAIFEIVAHKKNCKACPSGAASGSGM